MSDKQSISRGVLAELTGVNAETIRYYEKVALMPDPGRTTGGHRVYDQQHILRLRFIRRCREIGFTIDEIRELLSLVDGEKISCAIVKNIADAHMLDIRAKITDLKRMEKTLRKMSANCSGADVPDCPIIEVLQKN